MATVMVELLGSGLRFDDTIIRPEHTVELFWLLPHAKLAVLPNTDHSMRRKSSEWLFFMLIDFLDAPMPE